VSSCQIYEAEVNRVYPEGRSERNDERLAQYDLPKRTPGRFPVHSTMFLFVRRKTTASVIRPSTRPTIDRGIAHQIEVACEAQGRVKPDIKHRSHKGDPS